MAVTGRSGRTSLRSGSRQDSGGGPRRDRLVRVPPGSPQSPCPAGSSPWPCRCSHRCTPRGRPRSRTPQSHPTRSATEQAHRRDRTRPTSRPRPAAPGRAGRTSVCHWVRPPGRRSVVASLPGRRWRQVAAVQSLIHTGRAADLVGLLRLRVAQVHTDASRRWCGPASVSSAAPSDVSSPPHPTNRGRTRRPGRTPRG